MASNFCGQRLIICQFGMFVCCMYVYACMCCCCFTFSSSQTRRYRDPDADHRVDFDGPPVAQRAQRRFQQHLMVCAGIEDGAAAGEGVEDEQLDGGIPYYDATPTEVELEHVPLREALILNFEVLWRQKKVQWLKYPKRNQQM